MEEKHRSSRSLRSSSTDKRTDACSRPLCYTLKFLAYKKRDKNMRNDPKNEDKIKFAILDPRA